jgi:hypothetical protein
VDKAVEIRRDKCGKNDMDAAENRPVARGFSEFHREPVELA